MSIQIVSGIYRIRNTIDDKVYVGSTENFYTRWQLHWKSLMEGNHRCRPLQIAWDEYGGLFFIFEIIELVECKEDLIPREQHHINAAYDANQHYNTRLLLRRPKSGPLKVKPVVKEKPLLVNGMLTLPAAAAELGVSRRRLRVLCAADRVKGAVKYGRDWLIPEPVVVVAAGRVRPGKIKLS